MSSLAYGLGGRIGNRVRNPDGTAAVSAEAALVDESQSLGKPEKAERTPKEVISKSASQKTCFEIALPAGWRETGHICVREYGCNNLRVVAAVFIFLRRKRIHLRF